MIWDHTVLPATRHRWTSPTSITARWLWLFSDLPPTDPGYPKRMIGWVNLDGWLYTVTALQSVFYPNTNHLIVAQVEVKLPLLYHNLDACCSLHHWGKQPCA